MPPPVHASRLEKAAFDNGFDLERPTDGGWLCYGSSQCSLRIWLRVTPGGAFAGALSQQNVANALGDVGTLLEESLPTGAAGARLVWDIPTLHRLIRRAFQLGKTLPDELLHLFTARTATLPRTTEAERLVVQRVGQEIFREGLLEFWEGHCAITGLAVPELLRASHIKPWAACHTDAERLDVYNGRLLAPPLDSVFDNGFITVSDSGAVVVSAPLSEPARHLLGLGMPTSLRAAIGGHLSYLQWHRERVFKGTMPGNAFESA